MVVNWIASHPDVQSTEVIQVPVVFHIIKENDQTINEVVGRVQDQLDVMNDAFAPDFRFYLLEDASFGANPMTYVDAAWWGTDSGLGLFKPATRFGGSNVMNVWWTELAGGILGYATFPSSYQGSPDKDGIVNLHSTVMGGSSNPYNEGDTWVHEAGHWLGLYHSK